VKKAWYVGPGVETESIAKWELRHEAGATMNPRAEFAAVLRSLGAVVEGEHSVVNGKPQRIRTENDKRGEQTIFTLATLTEWQTGTRKTTAQKARNSGSRV
jgi:putative DNA primase/helicase